jgi:protein O-mannosyl-transferase
MLAVALCTAVVFGRVLQCEFLRWDDQDTISLNPTFNPKVNWDKVSEYWDPDKAYKSLWYPVTCTVWAMVASISPRGPANEAAITLSPILFHGLNLLLHCVSAAVVYAILRKLVKTNISALLGALFYALHPVMVEPVAWASGTKDVLAGCISLLAIFEYVRFRDSELPRQEQLTHYFVAILCFIIALLCKPSSVTLPLIVLAIDWLLLKSTLREASTWALPWLLGSVPIVLIGMRAQPAQQTGFIEYWMRPFIAGDAIAFYIGKILWPMTLVIDYGRNPTWLKQHGMLMYLTTAVTIGLIGLGILWRKAFPALLAGLAVLTGATLPVLGLMTFEFEWYSTVADHYLYLAVLGPAIVAAMALEKWRIPTIYAAAGLVLALFAVRDVTQIAHWRNTNEMHQHVIKVNAPARD